MPFLILKNMFNKNFFFSFIFTYIDSEISENEKLCNKSAFEKTDNESQQIFRSKRVTPLRYLFNSLKKSNEVNLSD